MIKYIFIVVICFFAANTAKASAQGDTVVTFYKYWGGSRIKVDSPKNADFVRLVYPDSVGKLSIVKEFYKTGVRKFLGKMNLNEKIYLQLTGQCISYYPNGKKRDVVNYVSGIKSGMEYLYWPNGHLHGIEKHINSGIYSNSLLWNYWECYDAAGNITCKDGNGKWLVYDDSVKNVIFSGPIIKGVMEGEWQGTTLMGVPIKYTMTYKHGVFIAGKGFDSEGKAYPFMATSDDAINNKNDILYFLEKLNRHLVLPKDNNGHTINIDTVHIVFNIEKDGHITGLRTLGKVNNKLNDALNAALTYCSPLTPSRYYGIPYRTELTISLKPRQDEQTWYGRIIDFKGKVLEFLKPGETSDDEPF